MVLRELQLPQRVFYGFENDIPILGLQSSEAKVYKEGEDEIDLDAARILNTIGVFCIPQKLETVKKKMQIYE